MRANKNQEQERNSTVSATLSGTSQPSSGELHHSRSPIYLDKKVQDIRRTATESRLLSQTFRFNERLSASNPELSLNICEITKPKYARLAVASTKSENSITDSLRHKSGLVSKILQPNTAAESEVCLSFLFSSHNVKEPSTRSPKRMGERSMYITDSDAKLDRQMEDSSSNSTYGSRRSVGLSDQSAASHSVSAALRIPIIGYEVMEERARFTVYKLRVQNPGTNDCWLVLRRYTDFVRLNNRIKQVFPHINLALPRKKIFGDNFNAAFLDNRVQGLQIFVNSVMSKAELRNSKFVREFFCLDEPPTYSESMEECRAIFEAQEETIAHLKMQISNKNDLIMTLQQRLCDEIREKEEAARLLAASTCKQCTASTTQ